MYASVLSDTLGVDCYAMPTARNYMEVLAFVAVWMAAAWIFHLDANAYLLLGVPLVTLFQLFIRRRPLQELWVRDAAPFRLGWAGIVIAALFAIVPGYELVVVAFPQRLWVIALWLLCAVAGAVFAAFALRQQHASATRRGLRGFIAAVLIGVAYMAAFASARHHSIGFPLPKLFFLLKQFLAYFAVCFVLEEVAFRGAFDSHIYQPRSNGQATGSPWRTPANDPAAISAIFVSALWGVWHLPVVVSAPSASAIAAAIPALIVPCTLVGVPLSFCWRASGTLVLPAAAHALIDAYRNTVL
jgi:CAAX prenyl protease-like protein